MTPIHRLSRAGLPAAALALLAPGAPASAFTEGFDGGANAGAWELGWFLGSPLEPVPEGGNPGWMIRRQLCCGSFPPHLHTVNESVFTGDFRARGVARIAVDVKVFAVDPVYELHPISLRLHSDNGTPEDLSDDWGAVLPGGPAQTAPPGGGDWKHIEFAVPACSEELPEGWEIVSLYPFSFEVPEGADWGALIRDVRRVSFDFGPPVPDVFKLQYWDYAADNVTISLDPPCTADLDGDGHVGFADLSMLLGAWGACPPASPCPADLDVNGSVGFADLSLLLGAWG